MRTTAILLAVCVVSAAFGQTRTRFVEKSLADLTVRLLSSITKLKDDDGGNVVLSPSSVFIGIGMLYAGMDGKTKEAVRRALNFPSDDATLFEEMTRFTRSDRGAPKLVANMITVRESANIKLSFAKDIEQYFHGSSYYSDFDAPERVRRNVNVWVSNRTKQKIRELMPSGSVVEDTSVVLVNALYFKSEWEDAFDEETKLSPFKTSDGKSVKTEMMTGDMWVGYRKTDEAEVIAMPFSDPNYAMVFVLPAENSNPRTLLKSMDFELMKMVTRPKEMLDNVNVLVTMPKFNTSMGSELSSLLRTIPGLDQVFSRSANFSKMAQHPVKIGNVNHKAVIDVGQKGVEAAAATSISIVPFANFEPEVAVTMDRPFLYFIVEKPTNAIHIAGVFNGPGNV